jgi:hypothetical protein
MKKSHHDRWHSGISAFWKLSQAGLAPVSFEIWQLEMKPLLLNETKQLSCKEDMHVCRSPLSPSLTL